MKKVLLLLITFILAANINAATVNVNTAKTIASNFYKSNSAKDITVMDLAYTATANDCSPAYYVFNVNKNDGFVIITADDAALPIIGYATTGHFDSNNLAPALTAWLANRALEISYIKAHNLQTAPKAAEQWQMYERVQNNSFARSTGDTAGPFCTTIWGQQGDYGTLCPGHTTGCTATAMAQIMKYWNYPVHGYGSVSYDDTTSLGFTENYGIQSANFDSTTYDWPAMPNDVTSANTAVATLMYQIAVSVYSDFNPLGTSANMVPYDSLAWKDPYGGKICAQWAYAQFFGYDSASMQGLQRDSYTLEAWDSILENELSNGRPLQYGGYTDDTKTAGHTWVVDGFDANNFFHMNWGWGNSDGYYNIDTLDAGGYQLNTYDEALIGIQPNCIIASVPVNTSDSAAQNIEGGSTTLSATGNGTLSWYNADTGGTYLGSGGSYTTPALSDTTTFYVQDSGCTASARTPITVNVISGGAGIAKISEGVTIIVYPNPSTGTISFKGIQPGCKVEIYDLLGETIQSSIATDDNYAINLAGNAAGVYFYRVINNSNVVQQGKLVVE